MSTSTETVISVADGDTFGTEERVSPIRVVGYDAPELNEDLEGWEEASTALGALLMWAKKVYVEFIKKDVYGRDLCKVYYRDENGQIRNVAEYMEPYDKKHRRRLEPA